ncbi:MAG: polysaccharide deacetylase [Gaiellales bacterium]
MALWIGSFKANNPSMISRGEFATIGLPRLLALLQKHGVPATFFGPGHTAHCYPDLVRRIESEGHEIGHHGWVHENPALLERDAEIEVFERGFEALEHAGVERPVGYRSAAWDFSPNSIEILLNLGFAYDTSCMANDFYPYYLRQGDRWSTTEPYVFGELVDLVEIGPSWGLDDFPPLEYVWGANTGPMTPSQVMELWQGEFDYMIANCPGSVYTLTCHPQFIGRGGRITMLERLIEHMKGHSVRFERLRDVAVRFREENPLQAWAEANPHRAGATARSPVVHG